MPPDFRGLGIVEWPAEAASARAAKYREKATQLRDMAYEGRLLWHVRDDLLRLAEQFDALADTVERRLTY
jgi:hypothetical protein